MQTTLQQDPTEKEGITAVEREIQPPEQERTSAKDVRKLEHDAELPRGEEEVKIGEVAARVESRRERPEAGKASATALKVSSLRKNL